MAAAEASTSSPAGRYTSSRRPTAKPRVGADPSASRRSATVSGVVNAAMSGMAVNSATRSRAA